MQTSLLLGVWDLTQAYVESQRTPLEIDGDSVAVSLEFDLQYGSGGLSGHAVVQTAFIGNVDVDPDTLTWRDIARADFAQAPVIKHCNMAGMLSKNITAYVPLTAEGVNDGIIGDVIRVVVTSAQPYSDSTLSVRACVRKLP